jgi:hypothetical protein
LVAGAVNWLRHIQDVHRQMRLTDLSVKFFCHNLQTLLQSKEFDID